MRKQLAKELGDENAPVVIEEYASLSCNHCASFHKDTFPKLKEEYIDTGKVYFIYNDFPLNASALDGAMVARCMPEKIISNSFRFSLKHRKTGLSPEITRTFWNRMPNYSGWEATIFRLVLPITNCVQGFSRLSGKRSKTTRYSQRQALLSMVRVS